MFIYLSNALNLLQNQYQTFKLGLLFKKLIRRNFLKAILSFGLIGVQNNLLMHVSLLGLFGGIFIFIQILKETSVSNSREPNQTLRSAASDLILQCLWMSHKKDDRRIWVKTSVFNI